jgi:hypothetical protein
MLEPASYAVGGFHDGELTGQFYRCRKEELHP